MRWNRSWAGGEREGEKGIVLCSVVWFFRCVLCDLSDLIRLCSTEVQFDSVCVLGRDACLKLRTLSCACGVILRLSMCVGSKICYCQVVDCHSADCVGFCRSWMQRISDLRSHRKHNTYLVKLTLLCFCSISIRAMTSPDHGCQRLFRNSVCSVENRMDYELWMHVFEFHAGEPIVLKQSLASVRQTG